MRALLLVIDGFGIGEMPDADKYGDKGSNTLLNLYNSTSLKLPNLTNLGLFNIDGVNISNSSFRGSIARLKEKSNGKDTTTGHYEMMGIITKKPNPTFEKFPDEIIEQIEKEIGTKTIGNYAQSGTVILNELGQEHLNTGYPIIYTSADSVLQVATHINKFSIEELYEMCQKIRALMKGKYAVSRVIARPFDGEVGNFTRLPYRKDFALAVPSKSILDTLVENKIKTIGIGKIFEVFNGKSIDVNLKAKNNFESSQQVLGAIKTYDNCFIFANFVDTDMLFGHRNDITGYKNALEEFDAFLPKIFDLLSDEDVVIITGDHGCDPTTKSSDHSREYTPLVFFSKNLTRSSNLSTLDGFDNCGKIVLEFFKLEKIDLLRRLGYDK